MGNEENVFVVSEYHITLRDTDEGLFVAIQTDPKIPDEVDDILETPAYQVVANMLEFLNGIGEQHSMGSNNVH